MLGGFTWQRSSHYYTIISKWCSLQEHALRVYNEVPDLVHTVRYEGLLQDKKETMKRLMEFIGERRVGQVLRRGSVVALTSIEDLIDGAKKGGEAAKAALLSPQWANLVKGPEFAAKQFQKWRTQLLDEEIVMIESVAHTAMKRLGYEMHLVNVSVKPIVYTPEQEEAFTFLNKEGIAKMHSDMAVENPEHAQRRAYHKALLAKPATLITEGISLQASPAAHHNQTTVVPEVTFPKDWPAGAGDVGYLPEAGVAARLDVNPGGLIHLGGGFGLRWAAVTQRGYYPSTPDKDNQDSYLVSRTHAQNDGESWWFSVYDGHGATGDKCAQYACGHVLNEFEKELPVLSSATPAAVIECALTNAHLATNKALAADHGIDDTASGTTATTCVAVGCDLYVSNIGDSRVMLASINDNGDLVTQDLSQDQTPFRSDERERIRAHGGHVMTTSQLQGAEPMHEDWTLDGEPPRVWQISDSDAKIRIGLGGTAFTRSIGDSVAETLGVCAEPEFVRHTLTEKDKLLVIASDGITEFISTEECLQVCTGITDPLDACRALVGESYKRWIRSEDRTDDITVIVAHVEAMDEPNADPATLLGQVQALQRQLKLMQEERKVQELERKAQESKHAAEMTAVGAQLKLFGDCLIASGKEKDAALHMDAGRGDFDSQPTVLQEVGGLPCFPAQSFIDSTFTSRQEYNVWVETQRNGTSEA